MSGHTPGPWHVSQRATVRNFFYVHAVRRHNSKATYAIARGVYQADPQSCDEINASARLIAAAPELLEALQNIIDGVGCQPGYISTLGIQIARAAILKATGEV